MTRIRYRNPVWHETGGAGVTKTRLVSLCESLRAGPYTPDVEGGWENETVQKNCDVLIEAGLKDKSLPLAAVAVDLLADRQPDTVRGIMYAVVSAGWLPDTSKKSYGRIQRLLNVLRKREVIPFKWIVDNIRTTEKPSSWAGLADYADTVRDAYRLDFWRSLPDYVCIITEKDTAAGRILPVTRKFDVALHPLRGFSSTTFSREIAETWRELEKPIHVYYIGDHDPSGRSIERSVRGYAEKWSEKTVASWTRLAVEPDQFEQYRMIPLEPKKKDSRYTQFVREWGPECAEVEAVPADELRRMVREAIESHIPQAQWQRLQRQEAAQKKTWTDFMSKLKGVG